MPHASAEAIALTGMMGAGKSTVAAHLGRLLSRRLVSTDAEVERRAGKSIARIFAEDGEAAFRALERAAVSELAGPMVVDLGGGAFCDPPSAVRLLATARVVFLDVSAAEAARRLGAGEGRPLAATWERLLASRLPLYRRAHHTIPVDGKTAEAVARVIVDLLRAIPSPQPSPLAGGKPPFPPAGERESARGGRP